jgi:chromosome segregation ATPase
MLRVWEANNPEVETGIVLTTALQKTLQGNLGYEVSRARQELQEKLDVATETISDLVRENEQLAGENAQMEDANGKLLDAVAEAKGQAQQLQEAAIAAKPAEAQQRAECDHLRASLVRAQLHTSKQTNWKQAMLLYKSSWSKHAPVRWRLNVKPAWRSRSETPTLNVSTRSKPEAQSYSGRLRLSRKS